MIIKNRSVILILLVFLISSVHALDNIHKQSTDYNVIFSSDNETSCNITFIQYPDNTLSPFLNYATTKSGQYFTYNLSLTNFNKVGVTCIFYTCLPNTYSNSVCTNVTPSGYILNTVQVSVYIFFLLVCLALLFLSFRLIINNPYKDDKLKPEDEYHLKQESRFNFYLHLLKKKFWIVGIFGIYMFLFIFSAVLNNLAFNLNISELNIFLIYFNDVMAWLTIPFVLFWFVYILLYFFSETTDTLKYQFGRGTRYER